MKIASRIVLLRTSREARARGHHARSAAFDHTSPVPTFVDRSSADGTPRPVTDPRAVTTPSGSLTPVSGIRRGCGDCGRIGDRTGVPSAELRSTNVGTGDVWSNAADLAWWPHALASREVLSSTIRDAIFTQQAHISEREDGLTDVGYCYGWFSARYENLKSR